MTTLSGAAHASVGDAVNAYRYQMAQALIEARLLPLKPLETAKLKERENQANADLESALTAHDAFDAIQPVMLYIKGLAFRKDPLHTGAPSPGITQDVAEITRDGLESVIFSGIPAGTLVSYCYEESRDLMDVEVVNDGSLVLDVTADTPCGVYLYFWPADPSQYTWQVLFVGVPDP